jgi:hypothetical protein
MFLQKESQKETVTMKQILKNNLLTRYNKTQTKM